MYIRNSYVPCKNFCWISSENNVKHNEIVSPRCFLLPMSNKLIIYSCKLSPVYNLREFNAWLRLDSQEISPVLPDSYVSILGRL